MSVLFDLFKAFSLGVVVFFVIPICAAALPWERPEDAESRLPITAKEIIDTYHGIAMAALHRGVMLKRSHGGLKLKKSEFDARLATEKLSIGGEEKHFQDPEDYMSTFHGHPFGLAHEDRAAIVDARSAFFGGRLKDLAQRNELERSGMIKGYFGIDPTKRVLVNLNDVKAVIQKNASPGLVDMTDAFAEKSQHEFNSTRLMQQTTFFIALGIGVGLMWLLKEVGGKADLGKTVPIMLGGFV